MYEVSALAEEGTDFNTARDNGAIPVFIAAQNGHVEVVRVLRREMMSIWVVIMSIVNFL